MRAGTAKTAMFWPLVLVTFVTVFSVIFAGLLLAGKIDRVVAQREQTVVANGIRDRIEEVGHLVDGQAVWDDAVRHLDNRFDLEWARDNTGTVLCQIDGFDDTFVLSSDDRAILASDKEGQAPVSAYAPFAGGAGSLVAAIRLIEARHGSALAHPRAGKIVNVPNVASGLVAVDNRIYILSATAVEPDFGRAALRGPRAPVIVTARRIDNRLLDALDRRFLLNRLRLYTGAVPAERSGASVTLRSDSGTVVATLVWSPETPGRSLLHRFGPLLVTILTILSTGLLVLYRRSHMIASSLMTSEARAIHLAYHDALTGLPNRILLCDRLGSALTGMRRRGDMLAVLCLDLDRFKTVNDTYGHHVGDELIQKVGRVMSAGCSGRDIVARLSGDEFAIIQFDASADEAVRLATRLTEALREPLDLSVGQVFIGCSVGITMVSDHQLEPAEILRRADLALYRAKETMRGSFAFFEPAMDTAVRLRRDMEGYLRAALLEGTLQMVYQPQVNDRSGITGVEALMRWHHLERGNISPAVFISIAEECGLIVELGMFALRQAFEDSKRWSGIKVAINVSAKQLRMKDFVSRIIELTVAIGVSPHDFELEITEGTLLGDDPDTYSMLRQLRDHGFELALDDFGTGYSSLSYLQRYPINRIKIDQSFTSNLGVSDEAEAFIVAIVKLARALRLSVIAEGVETITQHDRLAAAGCADMQGYLFSKPVSAEAVGLLLAASRKAPLAA